MSEILPARTHIHAVTRYCGTASPFRRLRTQPETAHFDPRRSGMLFALCGRAAARLSEHLESLDDTRLKSREMVSF